MQGGWRHTLPLTSSGYLFTWGSIWFGELGHGNVQVRSFCIPCLVEELHEPNIVQISSIGSHCAVLVDPTNPSIIRESQQDSFNKQEDSDVVF